MATYNGDGQNNTYPGTTANDKVNGAGGDDTLYGGAGNDTLDGGTGNDWLSGGTGNDAYRYGTGYGNDVIDNAGGAANDNDTIQLTNLNAADVGLYRIGNDLVLTVLADGSTLTVSQYFTDADHTVDRIRFANGTIWNSSAISANLYYPPTTPSSGADVINGNPIDDALQGLGGNDTLYGNGGNDTLDGGSGADYMAGGVGNDTYLVDDAGDVVVEASNAGTDTVQSSISYALTANVENLMLVGSANANATGNSLANTLTGNSGNNQLDGGTGADNMAGGVGDDTYIVERSGDVVTEAADAGSDTVRASINYTLGSNVENLELTGASNLNGTGNSLANRLTGNSGNNLLDGGTGNDWLAGRQGSDTYRYGQNYGNDVIDNSGGNGGDVDRLQLVGLNPADVRFTHSGNDLVMTVLGTSQTLTVQGFYLDADHEVDRVVFANGTTWNSATLKANVASNTAPTSSNDNVITLEDTPAILQVSDFGSYSDAENTPLVAVKITTLPVAGNLQYHNGSIWVAVTQDQVITKADLDAGRLQFLPGADANGGDYASIGFKVSDGTDFALSANTLAVNVTAVNDAPTLETALPDQVGSLGQPFTYTVHSNAFADVDAGDSLTLSARLANGDPLPAWLSFDAVTRTLSGTTPAGTAPGAIDLAITATDSGAIAASDTFTLNLLSIITGTPNTDTLNGTEFADAIYGLAGDDTLDGLGGNDTLQGGGGLDYLFGGDGNDTLIVGSSGTGSFLLGQAGDDTLDAHNLSNTGGYVNLLGGSGNDTYLVDGTGDLTISDNNTLGEINVVQFAAGINPSDLVFVRPADSYNDSANILISLGNGHQLSIGSMGSPVPLDTGAGSGVQLFRFADGTEWGRAEIQQRAGFFFGTTQNDSISGSDGHDYLSGATGDDQIFAGAGNDLLVGSDGNDLLFGEDGDDILGGGHDDDVLDGGSGNDRLFGSYGNDTLSGGAGNDTLAGDNGSDVYRSSLGGGADTLDNRSASAGDIDAIQFDPGILPAQVGVSRDGANLVLALNASDNMTVLDYFAGGVAQIDEIRFEDGTVWSPTTIEGMFNTPPSSSNDSITTLEDTGVLLGETDFGNYNDTENTLLSAVQITTLPLAGSLQYHNGSDWVAVTQDQVISKADLDAGNLRFVPGTNANGNGYASIGFKVGDGTDFALNTNTLTVNVTPVNDAPTGVASTTLAAGSEDTTYFVSAADLLLGFSDVDGDQLSVANLVADHGSVVDNGNGTFTITPTANYNGGVNLAYDVVDGHSGSVAANRGFMLAAVNDAPVLDHAISAQSFQSGQAFVVAIPGDTFSDPDGDSLSYSVALANGDALPAWLTFDAETASLSGTPSSSDSGSFQLRVMATDIHGATFSTTFLLALLDGSDIAGTGGDDNLSGTVNGERMFGLAGSDWLFGGPGSDILDGGADPDLLFGEAGNDVLLGGDGDDYLGSGQGNDQLSGGAGSDRLDGGDGNDQLYGDDGDDHLDGGYGNDSIVAGIGNDTVNAYGGSDTIDLGAGDDKVDINNSGSGHTVTTTGSGADTINLQYWVANGGASVNVVTDFTAGPGGDVINFDPYSRGYLAGWDGNSNPFGAGFMRLVQSGADTLLQIDADGAAGGTDYQTAIVLQGVTTTDLTSANFTPGFNPDGGFTPGETWTGSSGDENRTGTPGDDQMSGLAGNDTLYGGPGSDLIDGGTDQDRLFGEGGDDVLLGGDGNDTLAGGRGNNQLSGGAGDDYLDNREDGSGDNKLSGGAGFDQLYGGQGNDELYGDDGSDYLDGGEGNNQLYGGYGDDHLVVSGNGTNVLDGADGNDQLDVRSSSGNNKLSGGAGFDQLYGGQGNDQLYGDDGGDYLFGGSGNDSIVAGMGDDSVADDSGSDTIDLGGGNDYVIVGTHYDGLGGKITTGSGADTIIFKYQQWLANGGASVSVVTDFTAGPGGDRIYFYDYPTGSWGGIGNPFGNGLMRLVQSGTDTLLQINSDWATGGTNYQTAVVLQGVTATDLTSANFSPGYDPNGGGVNGQTRNGTTAGESLDGNYGDDHLYGLAGNDTLNGNGGNDLLDGGIGNDVLTGGFGADTFVFSSTLGVDNIDTIADFGSGADKLWLSNAIGSPFDALADGPLAAAAFDIVGDAIAASTDTRVIYDPGNGALFFDADGDGGAASVQFAILANPPLTLAASDIFANA